MYNLLHFLSTRKFRADAGKILKISFLIVLLFETDQCIIGYRKIFVGYRSTGYLCNHKQSATKSYHYRQKVQSESLLFHKAFVRLFFV